MKKAISAGGIIINDRNQIVLVGHKNGVVNLPKGHVEKDETTKEAAKREIYEETGIKDAELVRFLGKYTRFRIAADGISDVKTELKTIYIYLFKSNQKKLKPIDPKNPVAMWVPKKKILNYLKHPKDIKFINQIINKT